MKKKDYKKPSMQVVMLKHQSRLLAGSLLESTSTNLAPEDALEIEDTPAGILGR